MLFKTPELERQWAREEFHHDLRELLADYDTFCRDMGLPEPVITDLRRPSDPKDFSWHEVGCGADLRSRDLAAGPEFSLAWAWLQFKARRPDWECLHHDSGSGFHFHVARRDSSWRYRPLGSTAPPGGSDHG